MKLYQKIITIIVVLVLALGYIGAVAGAQPTSQVAPTSSSLAWSGFSTYPSYGTSYGSGDSTSPTPIPYPIYQLNGVSWNG